MGKELTKQPRALKRPPTRIPTPMLVRTRGKSSPRGWGNTSELLIDIHDVMKAFDTGKIDTEQARVYVSQFRNVAAVLVLQLEHARLSNRITNGSAVLPGIILA